MYKSFNKTAIILQKIIFVWGVRRMFSVYASNPFWINVFMSALLFAFGLNEASTLIKVSFCENFV